MAASTGSPPVAGPHGHGLVGRGVGAARRLAADYLPAALLLVLLLVAWETWVQVRDTRPYVLPGPSRIWTAFTETRGLIPRHLRATLIEALLGLGLAAALGVALAVIIAAWPLARRVLYPILVLSQSVPMAVLAPLLIIWFGFGLAPKVVVVALFGFFPIVVSTADALLGADQDLVGLIRSMGGGRLAVLRHVALPSALPAFFAGLKIAAAYAVLGAIIGEWVGATEGLGVFISRSQASYRVDRVMVAVFTVAALSIALFAAVAIVARLATPWLYLKSQEDTQ